MKLKLNSRKSRKGAFTLIEILLVLVIIGLVATAVVVNLIPQQEGAERNTAKILVDNVRSSLDTYRLNIGRYPTEEDGGLLALLKKPEYENERLGAKWSGPYVKKDTALTDPWGNQLVYEPADPEFKQPEIRITDFTQWARTVSVAMRTISATRKTRRKSKVLKN